MFPWKDGLVNRRFVSAVLGVAMPAVLVAAAPAVRAAEINACEIFSNVNFEVGSLVDWTLTAPNGDYLLAPTGPNPILDPVIDPADPANNPATLVAPVGVHFVGVKQIGDTAIDLKLKLAHRATAIAVPGGTTVTVRVWANRGRLEPFDTPASESDVLVKIFGWTAGSLPTVNASDNWSRTISWNPASQSFDFTGVSDGTWAVRTFSFTTPAATTLAYLAITVAGRNMNHDRYVAMDLCDAPTPARPSSWGTVKHTYR